MEEEEDEIETEDAEMVNIELDYVTRELHLRTEMSPDDLEMTYSG